MNLKFDGFYGDANFKFYNIKIFPELQGIDSRQRIFVIGNSYLFETDKLYKHNHFNYVRSKGYRQVGFRIIKESEPNEIEAKKIYKRLLKDWGWAK